MTLTELGYNSRLEQYRIDHNLGGQEVGRIISEHRERYIVRTAEGEYEAEITGNLRFTAKNREDFPAVGDWVALMIYDSRTAIIHHIFPRSSLITRQAAGKSGEIQVIAANIDYAFLVQAVDRDFNINRLERYLTICYASGVAPIIVLNKADLIGAGQLSDILAKVALRIKNVPVISISNHTRQGYDELRAVMENGKTCCMLGSSGVGKSTLLNNLSGKPIMETDAISLSTNKGRHVTSHRELVVLDGGGILIDNPGMREVGIADVSGGLEITFDQILGLSRECKYKDCTHHNEPGCAVVKAMENGDIDEVSYRNYLNLERERTYFETTAAERKRKEKLFGRIVKDYIKKDVKNKGS